MSQPFDLSLFPDLPPEVVKAFEAAQFELSVERAARQHEQAVGAAKIAITAIMRKLIVLANALLHDKRNWTPNTSC